MRMQHLSRSRYIGSDTRPVEAAFVAFPFVCFTLTLFTDIAFWRTSNLMWQNFSAWLLFAGLVFGALAALVRLFGLIVSPKFRAVQAVWLQSALGAIVLILAVVNSFVHAGDGWTAVVPYGLILSVATLVVMLVTAWFGSTTGNHTIETGDVYG